MIKFVDQVTLRYLREDEDFDAMTSLLHRAYLPLRNAGMNFNASHQDASTTRARATEGRCLIAELEGVVVGTVSMATGERKNLPEYYRRPHVWRFGQFGVEPALQGKGIGSLLLDRVEEVARLGGAAELALDTAMPASHLVEFYERRGFRIVERHRWEGLTYESYIMAKPI